MEYVLLEEVLAFHAEIKGVPPQAARDHVHRLDRLESALARPRNAAGYEGADLGGQAATLMWGLVRGHPFIDGNKRTALVVTRVFVELNGHTLEMSEDEKFDLVIGIANGDVTVEQTAQTLRPRVLPSQTGHAIREQRPRRSTSRRASPERGQRIHRSRRRGR